MFVLPWRNVSSDAQVPLELLLVELSLFILPKLFEARAMEYQNFIGPTLEIYQRLLSSVSANGNSTPVLRLDNWFAVAEAQN
jgi:hypothetical protein